MAQKFYVVWQGRETGIFTDWNTCKKQVDKFAGAKYKSFKTLAEAEAAFHGKHATPGKETGKSNKASQTSIKKTTPSTPIDPPSSSANFFVMLSPNPVPFWTPPP